MPKKSSRSKAPAGPLRTLLYPRATSHKAIGGLVVAVVAVVGAYLVSTSMAAAAFSDNFSSYATGVCKPDGGSIGPWRVVFGGGGCTKIVSTTNGNWLQESPAAATGPAETHSALTTGPTFTAPYTYAVRMKTTRQLRTGSTPNPWEVGWTIWNYTDNAHFYYLALKPNGWELGKRDPAYPGGQRFLATGGTPTFAIGSANNVSVDQRTDGTMVITVNGTRLTSFTDTERPYLAGSIGLYDEDATVRFTNVTVAVPTTATPTPTPTVSATPTPAPSTSATPVPATGLRTLPDPLYGVTVDDISNTANIVASSKALAHMPTTRIVFDENQQPSYYTNAINQIQPVSYIMGELLDSFYVKNFTLQQYHDRMAAYLAAFKDKVDLWEVGNEINGEWLGTTASVVPKMTDAYNQAKAAGRRTELTLYYNPNCWSSKDHEMFTWAGANIPDSMKQGLDYVLISYYEEDCNNYRPADWTPIFSQLHTMFPNARIGFGETGFANPATSSTLTKQQQRLTYYYGLKPAVPNYVGGYFWWNYYEDMLPYTTKPMWQTLNTAIQGY
jgi:hypothetical protein